ncbi:hypothetical protein KAR91_03510 [Candidatus Pacearchaeota archaeon]|nr:hypothetical protein [Candidatus Pacearchaeota archaeon]
MSSSFETNPRYRINADQAKDNVWTFNATAEDKDTVVHMSNDPEDQGNVAKEPLGAKLLSLIIETETAFREDGRILASDPVRAQTSPPKSYSKEKAEAWYENTLLHFENIETTLKFNLAALRKGKSKPVKKA